MCQSLNTQRHVYAFLKAQSNMDASEFKKTVFIVTSLQHVYVDRASNKIINLVCESQKKILLTPRYNTFKQINSETCYLLFNLLHTPVW